MIVVLNGPSSAGKSTLASAIQVELGIQAIVCSIDRLYAMAHPAHPYDWKLYRALTEATFGAAAGFARSGYDVVIDTVFERRTCFEIAESVLGSIDHRYVAVTCELGELERRESARGNRPVGLARRQDSTVLHDAPYEIVIDTTQPADHIARLRDVFGWTRLEK